MKDDGGETNGNQQLGERQRFRPEDPAGNRHIDHSQLQSKRDEQDSVMAFRTVIPRIINESVTSPTITSVFPRIPFSGLPARDGRKSGG